MKTNNSFTEDLEQKPGVENVNSARELTEKDDSKTVKAVHQKNHCSAMVAASLGRSAVKHVDSHRISRPNGDFAHTATNICYES